MAKIKSKSQYKRLKRRTFIVLLFILITVNLPAREIILDSIYIKPASSIYQNIISLKLENYKIAEAVPVDENVIFADWKDGNNLIYIKEFKDSQINYIYEYESNYRRNTKLTQINGAITSSLLSANGKWLLIKTITYTNDKTQSNLIIFNAEKNTMQTFQSGSYFTDFTFSPDGMEYYIHSSLGIKEIRLSDGKEKIVIPSNLYKDYVTADSVVTAHFSPDRKKSAVIIGGGGSYKCLIFKNSKLDYIVNDVTSASEFFWIDLNSFVYRSGYTAFYRVEVFNTMNRTRREIGSASMNTNIIYSLKTGLITFLKESTLCVYNTSNSSFFTAPVEGEDARFAADRNRFCVIFNNSLFILKKSIIENKMFFLKRNSGKITDIYKRTLENSGIFENEFSKQFVIRKLSLYSGFMKK